MWIQYDYLLVDFMDLQQVKREIEGLGKSPAAEKMYPITSNWVPVTDVLAVINRFEKYWKNKQFANGTEKNLASEIMGQ